MPRIRGFLRLGFVLVFGGMAAAWGSSPRAAEAATVYAKDYGFSATDATQALQSAIDTGADTVVVSNMGTPWIVKPIWLRSNLRLVFEPGVVVEAMRDEYHGNNDCLFSANQKTHIVLEGNGAVLRMHREDYTDPSRYTPSQWRHVLYFLSCSNVSITGFTLRDSGGDGLFVGSFMNKPACSDFTVRDVICDNNYRQGCSVTNIQGFLMENCVMRNTHGQEPQAGLNFEPDSPDMRLVNCRVVNCRFENNGKASLLILPWMLNASSDNIGISISDCYFTSSQGWGFQLGPLYEDGPMGAVTLDHCTFEDIQGPAYYIQSKAAYRTSLTLTRCSARRVGKQAINGFPAIPIIVTGEFPTLAPEYGGVRFIDCVLEDALPRHFLVALALPSSAGCANIQGNLAVYNPYGATADYGPRAHDIGLVVNSNPPTPSATATRTVTPTTTRISTATSTPTTVLTATRTATFTLTASPPWTTTPTATITPEPATASPTLSVTPQPNATHTQTPAATATPSSTASSMPTSTATASASATRESTFTQTATPIFTSTVAIASTTATPTSTASSMPTSTVTASASATRESTFTQTATPVFTSTVAIASTTATPSSTASSMPTSTVTASASATRESTFTQTATPVFTGTAEAATMTISPTATMTATATATAMSMTQTITPTPGRNLVYAKDFGWSPEDATQALQCAIASGARTVVISKMASDWVIKPVYLASHQELVFEQGVVVHAKAEAFKGIGDALFNAAGVTDLVIRGNGAAFQMPKEETGNGRHVFNLRSSRQLTLMNLTAQSGGETAVVVGSCPGSSPSTDITFREVVCNGLRIENADHVSLEHCQFKNAAIGLQVEPRSADQSVTRLMVRHCQFLDNARAGIGINLARLSSASPEASLCFEDCVVSSQTGWGIQIDPVPGGVTGGFMEFVRCRVEDVRGPGVCLKTKAAYGILVHFRECVIQRTGQAQVGDFPACPLYLAGGDDEYGGLRFDHVTIEDTHPRPFMKVSEPQTTLGCANLKGTIILRNSHGTMMDLGAKPHDINLSITNPLHPNQTESSGQCHEPATLVPTPDPGLAGKPFPNPARDRVSFVLPEGLNAMLRIYNLEGEQVLETSFSGPRAGRLAACDLRHLAPGIYFYVLETAEGRHKGKLCVIR